MSGADFRKLTYQNPRFVRSRSTTEILEEQRLVEVFEPRWTFPEDLRLCSRILDCGGIDKIRLSPSWFRSGTKEGGKKNLFFFFFFFFFF